MGHVCVCMKEKERRGGEINKDIKREENKSQRQL